MVIVFDPLVNVPLGICTSYTSPKPLYAPLVTPRELRFVGALGVPPDHPFTVACGLAPAKLSVVAMRSVTVPEGALPRLKLMVCGLLTSLKMAMGMSDSDDEPTV